MNNEQKVSRNQQLIKLQVLAVKIAEEEDRLTRILLAKQVINLVSEME